MANANSPSAVLKYRNLRIAWSVGCGIACVLLIVLWVRSYWWVDTIIGPPYGSYRFGLASSNGWLTARYKSGTLGPQAFPKWSWKSMTHADLEKTYQQMEQSIKGTNATFKRATFHFGWTEDWGIQFPHWVPALFCGMLAGVGWMLPSKFSLRTLLIAITLVAVVLGLIVWLR
jgi:hypothetical protein